MKAKNLKEFKALIKRYESITLEEIKEDKFESHFTAQKLTGFGNPSTCTLCQLFNCHNCIYLIKTESGCLSGINKKTYRRISDAITPVKLLNAFRARAKHMKTLLKIKL